MTQSQVQVLSKSQVCLLDDDNPMGCQRVAELALHANNLDMTGLEKELRSALNQVICAQMEISILLYQMKQRWDARNQIGCEDFQKFFCQYVSFSDYCQRAWGYAETRCKQFVKIGRTLVALTHQAQSEARDFIFPSSVAEALELTRLPEDSRLSVWQSYKSDGAPLPIDDSPKQKNTTNKDSANPPPVQLFLEIAEEVPSTDLSAAIASLITPWNHDEIMGFLAQKPTKADLVKMGHKEKHNLANIFHLTGFHELIGQELDDFLSEKLNLI